MMSAAATPNKKPSANALAPFSTALISTGGSLAYVGHQGGRWGIPGLREGPYMLARFTEDVGAKLHFRAVHELSQVDTKLSEAFMSELSFSAKTNVEI